MILEDIESKLLEVDPLVFYGKVDESEVTEEWNYIVFMRKSLSVGTQKKEYSDRFTVAIIRENYRPERDDYKIDLQLGDCELEVFVVKNAPARPNYPEALGLRHLAFKVADIDEAVAWLNERGIETEPVRFDIYTQNRMTFFKDPDGLPLEIHE